MMSILITDRFADCLQAVLARTPEIAARTGSSRKDCGASRIPSGRFRSSTLMQSCPARAPFRLPRRTEQSDEMSLFGVAPAKLQLRAYVSSSRHCRRVIAGTPRALPLMCLASAYVVADMPAKQTVPPPPTPEFSSDLSLRIHSSSGQAITLAI